MSSEQEFSDEQGRQIAALIREEIARRRISRQQLADKAKLSLSTLEKVLGGRRPLTLATAVRVEEALGVSLRRSAPDADAPLKDGVAPDGLGAYSRRGAAWLEGVYVTVRPSFGDKGAIYAYRTEILWDEPTSRLVFREAERVDAEFSQYGEVAVPNQSGHIYLVTNRHGQHRLITVSRPMITGEMYGVIATLLAGRGSHAHPDCRADRAIAGQECARRGLRPDRGGRRARRALPRASAAGHERSVRNVPAVSRLDFTRR